MPDIDSIGANQVAHNVQQSIAKLNIPHIDNPDKKRITFGAGIVSDIPTENFSIEQLVAHADQALYQKKHQRCDKVTLYQKPH